MLMQYVCLAIVFVFCALTDSQWEAEPFCSAQEKHPFWNKKLMKSSTSKKWDATGANLLAPKGNACYILLNLSGKYILRLKNHW